MIVTDENMLYDYDNHYYYLTETGAVTLANIEPNLWRNATRRLKKMGEMLHAQQIDTQYKKGDKYRSKESIIEYAIYLNENNERDAVLEALVTFAELAEYNELDLDVMAENATLPQSIIRPLRNANIYFKGEMIGYVPEEEYRDGY